MDFHLPQQDLDKIKVGQAVTAQVDTYPDLTFSGEILAIDPRVSVASRDVQVRASFENPDEKLLPGMFARVDIDVGTPTSYVTLPRTAIYYNSYGDIVYLVETACSDGSGQRRGTARQVFVRTGPSRGDQVAVIEA
ncbi:MAG: efflux RND transporter periplasmic adaptor subunit [Hyphomicrobiales bacterium]|nr:efflux RND transporter periplasmic adaptor subunit [Hyphomicrobiales bacterium]